MGHGQHRHQIHRLRKDRYSVNYLWLVSTSLSCQSPRPPRWYCCGMKIICSKLDGTPGSYTCTSSTSTSTFSCFTECSIVSGSRSCSRSGRRSDGGGGGGGAGGAPIASLCAAITPGGGSGGGGGGGGGGVVDILRRLEGSVAGSGRPPPGPGARYRCGVTGDEGVAWWLLRYDGVSAGAGSTLDGRLSR